MEKLNHHSAAIASVLERLNEQAIPDNHLLMDTVRHHYQLLRTSWDNKNHYFFRVRLHLHIHADAKIYILENRTEEDIAELLVAEGIAKSDIVLAFLPESVRQYSGYAVA